MQMELEYLRIKQHPFSIYLASLPGLRRYSELAAMGAVCDAPSENDTDTKTTERRVNPTSTKVQSSVNKPDAVEQEEQKEESVDGQSKGKWSEINVNGTANADTLTMKTNEHAITQGLNPMEYLASTSTPVQRTKPRRTMTNSLNSC